MIKRVLFVYSKSSRSRTFGDNIRIMSILHNLRKCDSLEIIEAPIPTFSLEDPKSSITYLHNIFPPNPLNIRSYFYTYKSFRLWLRLNASLSYLRKIVMQMRPYVVLAETSLLGWICTKICNELNIPCIIDCHSIYFEEVKISGYYDWKLVKTLEVEAFKKCDKLIVVSDTIRRYICEKFGIDPEKIMVIPNGSDPQKITAQYDLPIKVIYSGIFTRWENVDKFLDLAKQSKHKLFRFYVVGDGPLRKYLLCRIKRESIPVSYLGYVPRSQLFNILARMQIGISTSIRMGAMPIKVFDYMALGLPVVVPKIDDLGEIIEKNDCGVAVICDDINKYMEALNDLSDRRIWFRKSQNAVKVIREKFNWTKLTKPLIDLLLTI